RRRHRAGRPDGDLDGARGGLRVDPGVLAVRGIRDDGEGHRHLRAGTPRARRWQGGRRSGGPLRVPRPVTAGVGAERTLPTPIVPGRVVASGLTQPTPVLLDLVRRLTDERAVAVDQFGSEPVIRPADTDGAEEVSIGAAEPK